MKQAINIRLEKDIIQTLDEYANESDKTRTKVVPLKDVFAQAGINV